MDLKINQKSHVPVHVQLTEQIKHLILTKRVGVGERLPSIRALAGFLRVNRNTVARVMGDLEREGYVESRRGSGVYVLEPPVDERDLVRREVMEQVLDLAAAQGVSVEELAYSMLAHAGSSPRAKVKILFVECTPAELNQFSDELEAQLPVEIERVLVEDLEERISGEKELPWRLAVTTFFHVHEVEDLMEPRGIETVALLADANIESLQRLTNLPQGTRVGVVGWGDPCMKNLSKSLAGAGLDHLEFIEVDFGEGVEKIHALFEEVEAIVCSSITVRELKKIGLPEGLEVIEEDRTLDKGAIEMLGRMIRQLSRDDSDQ